MTVTTNSKPTAPPLSDEEIPVVAATAIPTTAIPATASATAYVPDDNTTPAAPARPGMSMVTKTVTYPDGRKVTTTEYKPTNLTPSAALPAAANVQYHPPRRDLGSRSCSVTCPFCQQTGLTKTNQQCGECTWISVILLLLFCFPLAWVPFVCPSCYDTEHFCRNCGKVVGWSRAECCNK